MPTRAELANVIRALSMDAIDKAKSGHPGAPLGMADMAESLWRGFMKHNPADPAWANRDRFVLSNGHASMLIYSLLHLTGYDLSMDDIRVEELSFTDVCVVCAGAKSILDLNLTMEYLETKGVPVVGYQTEELPAFFTRKSGLEVNYRVDTPEELAKALVVKEELNLNGGVLVANPIPEQFSMDSDYINAVIESAVRECDEKGIKGKEITPFLLDKIQKITAGSSLRSNIELVLNNATLASKIANEYCKLKEDN